MQSLSRHLQIVVAMCAFAAACGNSGTGGTLDAALSVDATDSPLSAGGQRSGGASGRGGIDGAPVATGGVAGGVGSSVGDARSGAGGTVDVGGGGTGGVLATGGSAGGGGKATGGTPATGGISATGGKATGGSAGGGGKATGGTPATGGISGTGGAATGGISGTGGAATGGNSGTGGAATGGNSGTGGAATGGNSGTGGAGTGGTPATGGTVARVCPDSSSYVGQSSWPDKLEVTAGATYCGHFKETRNLEQEYAAKAKLTVAAGTYPLATTAGTYDFALPVCFETRAGEPVPVFAGTGKVQSTATTNPSTGFRVCDHLDTQPISVGASPWSFIMTLVYWSWTGAPQPPVWDGSVLEHLSSGRPDDKSPGYTTDFELCDGPDCDDQWQDVKFEACDPDYPVQRHTIAFQGGQLVLDVRITGEVGGTFMLGAFTSASGTLNGQAFTQTDYWKLVYSADHHHFIRNFAVLFDAPIGDACGLKVLNFWGSREGAPLPDVYTIACDLTNLAAAPATSATLTRP